MEYCYFQSPIGQLLLVAEQQKLCRIGFLEGKLSYTPKESWTYNEQHLQIAINQLKEYFAGRRREFTVPLTLHGTDFKKAVLEQVAKVPYGHTSSYSDIAKSIKRPLACRAVGTANATNPLPIIIPCHRIIGKNGDLTGFGGGMAVKRFLLGLEQQATSNQVAAP